MKKIIIITVVLMLTAASSAFAAGAELAADTPTSDDGMQVYGGVDQADADRANGVLLGKMSKGVFFRSDFGTGGFAAASYHTSGSKAYGTAHNSTAIYFQDVGSTAAAGDWALGAADNSAFGDAWTSM